MKLLKISAIGLPLFSSKIEIDFLAMQRVTSDNTESMNTIFETSNQKFFQSGALSFIGINASGKTFVLRLISFIFQMLNNKQINYIDSNTILEGISEGKTVEFDVFFYSSDQNLYLLHTEIQRNNDKFIIVDESIKYQSSKKIKSKVNIFNEENYNILTTRNINETYLFDDVSIIMSLNKKQNKTFIFTDMLKSTNINELRIFEDCPPEIISFLDPTIEYLNIKKNKNETDIRLKFYEKKEIILNRPKELNNYLSSGTIKGVNVFYNAQKIIKAGGYLIIDELENHFNYEIVSTLINLFANKKTNPYGAILIFSTHYAKILDLFERSDNVYFVHNNNGITAEKFSDILKEKGIKKSEAYESGLLGSSVPMYESILSLRKYIISSNMEK